MMQCKRIQELLQADYLDGEVGEDKEQLIKEHLLECSVCRGLEKKLQAQRVLFQGAKSKQVPEHIWSNIRDIIIRQRAQQEESPIFGILKQLRDFIFAPRPAVILATAFSVIIMLAVFTNITIQNRMLLSKQNAAENIAGYSLNDQNGYVLYDLGTNIEEYFL